MLGRLSSEPFLDMATYSFDVVSDFDRQELVNALDQVRRDVGQRYDLKDSNTEIELTESEVLITTASDMTLKAVEDVLRAKATKRNLSLKIFDFQTPEAVGGSRVKQVVKLRKGLSQEIAKKLSKSVRDELKKVTVAIQGESLRITGKNKDDLQAAIQLVKSKEDDLDVPLQFENYR
ncbi:putative nucleotide-binding protein [Prochlorococcus marinus str. MIT 1320]|nr:putative nucleotide-binding protein [Prochlorococcus marinus str. MIT 1320]